MAQRTNSSSEVPRVKRLVNDSNRVEVIGPALVQVPGDKDYKVDSRQVRRFPAGSQVWVGVWPKEL